MGHYDLHMVHTPDGEAERYEAARQAFDTAVEERDALFLPFNDPAYRAAQKRVSEAYDRMYEVHASYLQFGNWTMRECRAFMHHFGMLSLTVLHPPERPDPEAFGISLNECSEYCDSPARGEAPEAVRRFQEAMEAHLSWAPVPADGVVAHKLGSPGGWIVTPAEIRAALSAYGENRGKDPGLLSQIIEEASWWPQWIEYLATAAKHGGFLVR
ncbi:hypothetical protein [Streptomyces sp. BRA346]|uniref:hypothetical protein n=1 Tax=Streptomyces sp. BRA346 TaxID=2878199 RepID=UPI0040647C3E